ncbi:hypothetical protein D3C87_1517460 [compost metagenome]
MVGNSLLARHQCARRRDDGATPRGKLRRLSEGLQIRRAVALHLAAGPSADAGGSGRITGADLCAPAGADRRQGTKGVAARHDGAALRRLQGNRGKTLLPRTFRPPRPADRADRHSSGGQSRPGGGAGSGTGAGRCSRLFPPWHQQSFVIAAGPAHRQGVDCRYQGRPPAS